MSNYACEPGSAAGLAAASDAIRGEFERIAMRGEVAIGEGIEDEVSGLFKLLQG